MNSSIVEPYYFKYVLFCLCWWCLFDFKCIFRYVFFHNRMAEQASECSNASSNASTCDNSGPCDDKSALATKKARASTNDEFVWHNLAFFYLKLLLDEKYTVQCFGEPLLIKIKVRYLFCCIFNMLLNMAFRLKTWTWTMHSSAACATNSAPVRANASRAVVCSARRALHTTWAVRFAGKSRSSVARAASSPVTWTTLKWSAATVTRKWLALLWRSTRRRAKLVPANAVSLAAVSSPPIRIRRSSTWILCIWGRFGCTLRIFQNWFYQVPKTHLI